MGRHQMGRTLAFYLANTIERKRACAVAMRPIATITLAIRNCLYRRHHTVRQTAITFISRMCDNDDDDDI